MQRRRHHLRLGDDRCQPRLFNDLGQPSGRIGRVEGNIGVARLKDRQGGDNQIDSSVNENADPRVRSDARRTSRCASASDRSSTSRYVRDCPAAATAIAVGRLRRLEREEIGNVRSRGYSAAVLLHSTVRR